MLMHVRSRMIAILGVFCEHAIPLQLFIIFWMAGCSAFNPSAAKLTTIPDQQTSEPSSTLVGAPGNEEILPTLVKLPTAVLPLQTLTNLPNLSQNEARVAMLDLVQNNGDCRLPCIWGLTPGVTDTHSRQMLLASIPFISEPDFLVSRSGDENNPGGFGFSSIVDNLRVSVGLSYYEKEGMISSLAFVTFPTRESIAVFGEPYYMDLLYYYLLPQLLNNYGRPSIVLIAPWPHDPFMDADYDPFSVVVIYQDLGIMAEYIAPNELDGGYYRACPVQGYLTLRTWDPNQVIPLEKIAALGAGIGISETSFDYFKPIEEATSISLEEFYQTFTDAQDTSCLETPVELWEP